VICPVGVEDLGEKWIGKGEADCVVTIQCLCSVPRPREIIGNLYGYLREGGEWIVYEHVKSHRGRGIEFYQCEWFCYLFCCCFAPGIGIGDERTSPIC
jgi:hypothetical protein